MPQLANGNVATIALSDTIYAAGLRNGDALGLYGGPGSYRARIPAFHIDVKSPRTITTGQGHALDISHGEFMKRWQMGELEVSEYWYAHAARPALLVHEITIISHTKLSTAVTLAARATAPSKDLLINRSHIMDGTQDTPGDVYVLNGTNKIPETAQIGRSEVAIAYNSPCALGGSVHAGAMECTASIPIPASDRPTSLAFLTSIVTNLTSANPISEARAALAEAMHLTPRALREEHEKAWKERLKAAGAIGVTGDRTLAQAVNASLYAIRTAARPAESTPSARVASVTGLSPGGLSTNGYEGHTFWDQETWMLPALVLIEPNLVRAALGYRWARRAEAARLAVECGQLNHAYCQPGYVPADGALRYPWESALTGVEVQYWNGKIGKWGEFEQHISADIALAAQLYYYATGDVEWLKEVGWPMIDGIARFYVSRASALSGGRYGLLGVMPPDEYHRDINNSAFTNAAAALTLNAAVELAAVVNQSVPAAEYSKIAAGLMPTTQAVPPGSGLKGQYHAEFDGYPGGDPKVKQADVVMLQYPLGVEMADGVKSNDLLWYENHTDVNGPAMTWAIFAIDWMRLGKIPKAAALFNRSYAPNVRPPFFVWRETLDGGCTPFLTGAGGFLQAVLYGAVGLRLRADRLGIDPPPPSVAGANVTKLAVTPLLWRGARLDVEVSTAHVAVSLSDGGVSTGFVVVAADGSRTPLRVGAPPIVLMRGVGEHAVMMA